MFSTENRDNSNSSMRQSYFLTDHTLSPKVATESVIIVNTEGLSRRKDAILLDISNVFVEMKILESNKKVTI